MTDNMNQSAQKYVMELIERARKAQEAIDNYTQEQVDKLVEAVVWNIVKEDTAQEICKLAFEETRMGDYQSKYAKLMAKARVP